eukprot:540732-Pelagomonas_calceolata.AAC.1
MPPLTPAPAPTAKRSPSAPKGAADNCEPSTPGRSPLRALLLWTPSVVPLLLALLSLLCTAVAAAPAPFASAAAEVALGGGWAVLFRILGVLLAPTAGLEGGDAPPGFSTWCATACARMLEKDTCVVMCVCVCVTQIVGRVGMCGGVKSTRSREVLMCAAWSLNMLGSSGLNPALLYDIQAPLKTRSKPMRTPCPQNKMEWLNGNPTHQ